MKGSEDVAAVCHRGLFLFLSLHLQLFEMLQAVLGIHDFAQVINKDAERAFCRQRKAAVLCRFGGHGFNTQLPPTYQTSLGKSSLRL